MTHLPPTAVYNIYFDYTTAAACLSIGFQRKKRTAADFAAIINIRFRIRLSKPRFDQRLLPKNAAAQRFGKGIRFRLQ